MDDTFDHDDPDDHDDDEDQEDQNEASKDRAVDLNSAESRRRRAAELRQRAAILDGGTTSDEDFDTLNGSDPTGLLQDAIWRLPKMTSSQVEALHRQQRRSYYGHAPKGEMERARTRFLISLETAATGAFQQAASADADIVEKTAYMALALRCIESFNKMTDRFERARGQPQQQIFVQHNRFDTGSQPVLQTVQAKQVGGAPNRPPLIPATQTLEAEPVAAPVGTSTRRTSKKCKAREG